MADHIEKGTSLWRDGWHRLTRNRAAVAGLIVLTIIVLLCICLPLTNWLLDPNKNDLKQQNLPPSAQHLFGTDQVGRDIFSRVIFGGRISIAVGLVTTFVSVTIGVTLGAIAGYVGGRVDSIIMRFVDFLFALPFLVLIILLKMILEPMTSSLTDWCVSLLTNASTTQERILKLRDTIEPMTTLVPVFIAIGALSWLTLSRIVRAQVQSVKNLEFVEAARSLGLGHTKILLRHILPNTLGPIIVYTTLTIPSVMLLEATLSFLGLGVKPPYSSWGILIQNGADLMLTNPLQLIIPAIFFSATLLSLNFLGDGLRDALDPKASKD